jgi:hypothetical protein
VADGLPGLVVAPVAVRVGVILNPVPMVVVMAVVVILRTGCFDRTEQTASKSKREDGGCQ